MRLLRSAALLPLVLSACRSPPLTREPAIAPEAPAAPTAVLSAPPPPAGALRETRTVNVGGRLERWSLVWTEPPVLDCVDDGWQLCLCFGKELGERGPLALVRARQDGSTQRLELGTMTLSRWRLEPGDRDRFPGKVDVAALQARPRVEVMVLGDYDHDGRATELVLERSSNECGYSDAVVVGVSRTRDELHVFATADAPGVEIALPHAAGWEKLRHELPGEVVVIPCGYKGGWPTYEMIYVSRDDAGLHARHRRYECDWVEGSPQRGKLILDRPWTGDVAD